MRKLLVMEPPEYSNEKLLLTYTKKIIMTKQNLPNLLLVTSEICLHVIQYVNYRH